MERVSGKPGRIVFQAIEFWEVRCSNGGRCVCIMWSETMGEPAASKKYV